jgi:hypothetical protein
VIPILQVRRTDAHRCWMPGITELVGASVDHDTAVFLSAPPILHKVFLVEFHLIHFLRGSWDII